MTFSGTATQCSVQLQLLGGIGEPGEPTTGFGVGTRVNRHSGSKLNDHIATTGLGLERRSVRPAKHGLRRVACLQFRNSETCRDGLAVDRWLRS